MAVFKKIVADHNMAGMIFDAVIKQSKINIDSPFIRKLIKLALLPRSAVYKAAAGDFEVLMSDQLRRQYKFTTDQSIGYFANDFIGVYIPFEDIADACIFSFKHFKTQQGSNRIAVEITYNDPKKWTKVFAKVLYKLCGNFETLEQSVEINGRRMKQGEWLAALLFDLSGEKGAMMATMDEALDREAS